MSSHANATTSLPVSPSSPVSGRSYRVAAGALVGLLLVVGVGWFFHTSPRPEVLGKYSRAWAAFLACVVAGEAFALAAIHANRRRLPALFRRLAFAATAGVLLVALIGLPAYIWAHHRYLSTQIFRPMWGREHPFLQWDQPLPGNPPLTKEPGVYRIVCMGGSTTQGYRIKPEQSYPAVLQTLLDARFGADAFEVINAGSCWHTTQHTLFKYLGNICDYQPDMIIEMHAWNDIYQCAESGLARGPFRRDYGHFMGALAGRLHPKDRFAERVWRNPFFDNLYSDFRGGPEHLPRAKPVDPLTPLSSFRRNLQHMAEVCAADGVRLVLASQPFLYKRDLSADELAALTYDDVFAPDELPGVEAMRNAMTCFNHASREVAEWEGLVYVDLEPCVPKDLDHFIDDVHYTPRGYRLVAEAVFGRIDWADLPRTEPIASNR
jgi:lysophospholipase L1-like esterase